MSTLSSLQFKAERMLNQFVQGAYGVCRIYDEDDFDIPLDFDDDENILGI